MSETCVAFMDCTRCNWKQNNDHKTNNPLFPSSLQEIYQKDLKLALQARSNLFPHPLLVLTGNVV